MPASTALGFEPRSLVAEPDATEVRRFRRQLEKSSGMPAKAAERRLRADTILRGVLAAGLVAPVVLIGLVPFIVTMTANPGGALAIAAFGVAVGGLGAWFVLRPIARRWRELRPWRRWLRLSRFAGDNGMRFIPDHENPPHAGLAFQQGKHRRVREVLLTPDHSFEIGTFTFVPTDNRSLSRDPAYGFLRIRLPRPVPHLVLLSVARRGLRGYSSVGLAFAESQRVRLEGDFDRYFAVYAPDGYGADARYVLTPDFMVRLIDNARDFDLEFIDDQLYVYSSRPWDLERLATWAWARSFAEVVGVSALRRTARFSDDRSAAPGYTVAPQGRRLKVGVPLVAGLIAAGWILFQVLRVILQLTNP